ncbi:nucleotide exchange factor GrpE [candidate division KSB1 bacterium]|nr:nucleotide exchange factor GrpE [candidate division KSB1 bacterium]MBL7094362.1 nucleotide exchange factor GrpE [candidate division KSB1 bacterium]
MHRDEAQNNVYEIKIDDNDSEKTENDLENTNSDKEKNVEINEKTEISSDNASATEQKYFDQLQRLRAEFANYKKRTENEKSLISEYIKSEFIKNLLPVIDDFERLLFHVNNGEHEDDQGVNLIYQKLMDTLKDQGLKQVDSVGEKFDPNFHEALLAEHHEDSEEDIVIAEWRKGYVFKDRLLRPAQVKVNKP